MIYGWLDMQTHHRSGKSLMRRSHALITRTGACRKVAVSFRRLFRKPSRENALLDEISWSHVCPCLSMHISHLCVSESCPCVGTLPAPDRHSKPFARPVESSVVTPKCYLDCFQRSCNSCNLIDTAASPDSTVTHLPVQGRPGPNESSNLTRNYCITSNITLNFQ